MLMLSSVLVDESSALHIRNAAGLALKNALSARVWTLPLFPSFLLSQPFFLCLKFLQENARQQEYSNRWLSLNNDAKGKIKQDALVTLNSSSSKAGNVASQVVAAIAAVELPQGQWADLIGVLLGFVNNEQSTPNLKITTLQTIGFICETIVSPFCDPFHLPTD